MLVGHYRWCLASSWWNFVVVDGFVVVVNNCATLWGFSV